MCALSSAKKISPGNFLFGSPSRREYLWNIPPPSSLFWNPASEVFDLCPEAPVSTLQIQTHHLPQDCILSLNQFLPCPIISSPENSPVVFLVKKTQAASTRSSIPTFRQRHTRTLHSLPCKVLPTVSQTASRLPLSASTRA